MITATLEQVRHDGLSPVRDPWQSVCDCCGAFGDDLVINENGDDSFRNFGDDVLDSLPIGWVRVEYDVSWCGVSAGDVLCDECADNHYYL